MLRRTILSLIGLIKWPKRYYKMNQFKRNAFFPSGMDVVSFGETAYCENKTGNIRNISIGHHCDIHARIIAAGKSGRIIIGNYTTLRGGVVGGG